jgi:hypothetical protein
MANKLKFTFDQKKANWAVVAAARDAAWEAGHACITLNMTERAVPIDTGTLRRSAMVSDELPSMEQIFILAKGGVNMNDRREESAATNVLSSGVRMHVSYNTPYASRLHEGVPPWAPRATDSRGREKPAEGGPKWLQNVLPRVQSKMKEIIQRAMRRAGL